MYRIRLQGVKKAHEYEELIKAFLMPSEFKVVEENSTDFDIDIPFCEDKNVIKKRIFQSLNKLTGKRPPWGIITGIRPVKLAGESIEKVGYSKTEEKLLNYFLVTPEKTKVALDMYKHQISCFGKARDNSLGIYIGIPFCPTRCLYCSFASNQVQGEKVDEYLDALTKEINFAKTLIVKRDLKVESLYIGGGTPTALDEAQLERLLIAVDGLSKGCKELTLEAGRPDSITFEKLRLGKAHGVDRISINPQTMKAETLKLIGREHSPEDINKAFEIAHKAGICNINSDVIAGLPGESVEDFANTLKEVWKLGPTDITVHSLTVKRASKLKELDEGIHYKKGDIVTKMLEFSRDFLDSKGYIPYYLYRQKYMSGAQENTGYAKPGCEGLYNVRIMDEHQSILALGAGGVSKTYFPKENRLERVANVTNYELYIERIGEMIQRKIDKF